MDFLQSINDSALSSWVRESESLWAYPAFITLHTAGLALLVGLNGAAAVLILISVPRATLAGFAHMFRYMWLGFTVNAITGVVLVAADATTMVINPVMWVKLTFVAAAVVLLILIQRVVFSEPLAPNAGPVGAVGKGLALASLLCWLGAIAAGRLTAYIGPVAGLLAG